MGVKGLEPKGTALRWLLHLVGEPSLDEARGA